MWSLFSRCGIAWRLAKSASLRKKSNITAPTEKPHVCDKIRKLAVLRSWIYAPTEKPQVCGNTFNSVIVTLWTVSFSSIKSHSQDNGVASLPLGGILTPSDSTKGDSACSLERPAANQAAKEWRLLWLKPDHPPKTGKNCLISEKTLLFRARTKSE